MSNRCSKLQSAAEVRTRLLVGSAIGRSPEGLAVLHDHRVVVDLLVDQEEEVSEADADLLGETLLGGGLLPRLRVGLLRDPSQESLEVPLVGGEVGGPVQRVEYGRVELRLRSGVRLDQ